MNPEQKSSEIKEKKSNLKNIKIEDHLKKLEKIVNQLEAGEIEIDKAFKLFEEGVALYEVIKIKMATYEKKIKILSSKVGESPQFSNFENNQ